MEEEGRGEEAGREGGAGVSDLMQQLEEALGMSEQVQSLKWRCQELEREVEEERKGRTEVEEGMCMCKYVCICVE